MKVGSFDKIGKELKLSDDEVDRLFSDLDAEQLARLDQYNEPRPNMLVIREKDIEKIKVTLQKHSKEFTAIIAGNWSQIEAMAASLTGASGVSKEEVMYEIVVSGILLGGMNEVFFEDKTLIPPGPRARAWAALLRLARGRRSSKRRACSAGAEPVGYQYHRDGGSNACRSAADHE